MFQVLSETIDISIVSGTIITILRVFPRALQSLTLHRQSVFTVKDVLIVLLRQQVLRKVIKPQLCSSNYSIVYISL